MSRAPNDTFPGDHWVKKIHPPKKTVVIGDGVERLYSRSSASGWTASDFEAEERQAISSYRSKRLEEASSYFQRKLKMEDDGEDFPIRSLRNVTGPLKEVMMTLFQGPNEVHALEFLRDCGVRNEVTKMDLLSILNSQHLAGRDRLYIMDCFARMREARRRNSETTTDLSSDGSSSSGSPSDKRPDKRCSPRQNERRLFSSGEHSLGEGSWGENLSRGGSSQWNSRSFSFSEDPTWGGPPAVLNSRDKCSLTGSSVEDIESKRDSCKQFASDDISEYFDIAGFQVDNKCSFDKTVGGSKTTDLSIGLGVGIINTLSSLKLQNLEEVYSTDSSSRGTPKNKMNQELCRRRGKSRLPGLSNILDLCDSPVLRVPDQNVISMYAEVEFPNQQYCNRGNRLITPPASSVAEPSPTPSNEIMSDRLDIPLASSDAEAVQTSPAKFTAGRPDDPVSSSNEETAPAPSSEIMAGRLNDPLASSVEKAVPVPSSEIIAGRLNDPLASGVEEAAPAPSSEIMARRPDDPVPSIIEETALEPSSEIMTGRLNDPLASNVEEAAPVPSSKIMAVRPDDPMPSSIDETALAPSSEIMAGRLYGPLASSVEEAAPAPSIEIVADRLNDPRTSNIVEATPAPSSQIMAGRLDGPLASSVEEAAPAPSREMAGRLDDHLASSVEEAAPTQSGDIMTVGLYDPLTSNDGVAALAQLPEHYPVPDEPCHWKDLPADIFQCPIRFCAAVKDYFGNRISGRLEEIEKLHEHMPVTTIAMLWQLKYLGAELAVIRDSREDIDNILEKFGKLSELQNKAVIRLMNFLKVFDGQFMDVLRKRVTRTEDALPPLWREIEPRPVKSSRP